MNDPRVTSVIAQLPFIREFPPGPAFALRQELDGDYGPANRAILAVYGMKGLTAIKELAWAYAEGRKSP